MAAALRDYPILGVTTNHEYLLAVLAAPAFAEAYKAARAQPKLVNTPDAVSYTHLDVYKRQFMDSLLFIIMLVFLLAGIGYGYGAGTFKGSGDVIRGVTKTFAGLAGLVFMLLMISQFIAYFNFSNMPNVIAVALAGFLEQANIGSIPLLIGFMLVIMLLDIIIPGSMPKWAIFAPIFVPLFMRLGTAPQTVLAAYRIGDSPMNVITPLMVYLPFILTVAQRLSLIHI